ncbi:hypothetical protein EJ06DRAFT_173817 [Trichodelitschia bisporula]|uniref:Uncharacterized protein n=1 Tax=Trichodelitschia bisporula TaxID=703511 RepID=A0A6G1HLG8_9PEZI|nr:hypothetical protein EJ06DRAFT_173817 [Trichodelitschia bisporula]
MSIRALRSSTPALLRIIRSGGSGAELGQTHNGAKDLAWGCHSSAAQVKCSPAHPHSPSIPPPIPSPPFDKTQSNLIQSSPVLQHPRPLPSVIAAGKPRKRSSRQHHIFSARPAPPLRKTACPLPISGHLQVCAPGTQQSPSLLPLPPCPEPP